MPRSNSLGEQINRIVSNAIDTRDFAELNRQINTTVNMALGEVKNSIFGMAADKEMPPLYEREDTENVKNKSQKFEEASKTRENIFGKESQEAIPTQKRPAGTVGGPLMMAGGIVGMIIFFVMTIGSLAIGSVVGSGAIIGTSFFSVCTLGGVITCAMGNSIRKRVRRFQKYLTIMGRESFFEIKSLAAHAEMTEAEVCKDLKIMINKGMFAEGHLDYEEKWFLGNHKVFQNYLDAKEGFERKKTMEREESQRREGFSHKEIELEEMLEKGRGILKEISDTNDQISSGKIVENVEKIERVIEKIFIRVQESPKLMGDTKKFIDYYLPITLKLVATYEELEEQQIQGGNILEARREIEETLTTIEGAFEGLLLSLFHEKTMDIATDISVLKTMMARDGLTGDEIHKGAGE